MTHKMSASPRALPDTDRPPEDQRSRDFPHGTVRLIPMGEAEPLLAEAVAGRLRPEDFLRQAYDRLSTARQAVTDAKGALNQAASQASAAHDFAERAKVAYERARSDARRAELTLRQRQRQADDAKLTLRQAYEQVAHLEGLNSSDAIVDLTLDAPLVVKKAV
jgi:hypothetical protein